MIWVDFFPHSLSHTIDSFTHSVKISVVTAPVGGTFPGGAPVLDLAPTGYDPHDTSAIYSVMVEPITLYYGDTTGNHTVYVIETYNAFGVSSLYSHHITL
jgi:hypothetical protein